MKIPIKVAKNSFEQCYNITNYQYTMLQAYQPTEDAL